MKKLALSLAAVAALAAAPSAASAQATDQGTINVSATIQTVLRFGAATALDFGTITPGQGATGQGSIELIRNVGTTLTFPSATHGTITGPGGTITPTYTCGVGATATAITTNFTGDCLTGSLALTAPSAGVTTQYVIFNGIINAADTNITPGSYTGTLQVLATQN